MLFNDLGNFSNESEVISISEESAQLINQAILLDGLSPTELRSFFESSRDVNIAKDEGFLLEKSIVRLDKKAKMSKAITTAVYAIAKEKNDKLFNKLVTVWKMRTKLENQLIKKYYSQAKARAKKQMAMSAKSKSGMVKKATMQAKQMIKTV